MKIDRKPWVGSKEVGEGRMPIEKSEPAQLALKLEFLKPFQATSNGTFTFTQTEAGTKTTWAMDGKNDFMSKAFHLVMDMDKLIGADFERGLAAMKVAAETTPKSPSGRWRSSASRTRCRAGKSCRSGWRRCWRSST
jgi:hypothetical protein